MVTLLNTLAHLYMYGLVKYNVKNQKQKSIWVIGPSPATLLE